ncbi:hypothetical protein [Serinibacter arcticus]|nr:hypothetical protein [Serinibacter arcticus]
MTETGAGATPSPQDLDLDTVRGDLAAALLAEPGVLRVEPTLAGMVRAWSADPAPEDLIRIAVQDGTADVALHLAVQGLPARLVAHRVRDLVRRLLREHGLDTGSVEVSVLTVEGAAPVPETVG